VVPRAASTNLGRLVAVDTVGVVPASDVPAIRLFVVDDGQTTVVARVEPVIDGFADETVLGGSVVLLRPAEPQEVEPDEFGRGLQTFMVRGEVPGIAGASVVVGFGLTMAALTAVVVSVVVTPWVGMPLGVAIAAGFVGWYFRTRRALTEAWQHNHRVLDHPDDRDRFGAAQLSVRRIANAWQELGSLIGIADPTPGLARSLWDLSEILLRRAAVRSQKSELATAKQDLPAGSRIAREVADRLALIDRTLAETNVDIERRITSLTDLADECDRFIREQQAIEHAREVVRRADRMLGTVAPGTTSPDSGEELGERTRAILSAYRELTHELPTD
jgi:hypothetical protein